MELRATPGFVAFARLAAEKCSAGRTKMLFLSYADVETSAGRRYKWVLNIVNRADFPGTPILTVNGWEMFYQPEKTQELSKAMVDFKDGTITIRPI